MNYRISIFPSKEIQDKANAYRKRYDSKYALIPPHITLKAEFRANQNRINELIAELNRIAQKANPFTLNIHKIGTFAPVTNTIYFKVEPVPELMHLFEEMHSGKFPKEIEYPFVPHITIAQDLSDGEYSDVHGTLQMQNVEFTDEVDRFSLLYQLDNGSWTVHQSFVFGESE